jgi:GxxExxY protein
MDINFLTGEIVDAAFQVHIELGPGLYEEVYKKAMAFELAQRGLKFTIEQKIDVFYKGQDLGLGYRADIIVEGRVLIEFKSVEALHRVHFKQIQTYLKLTNIRHGLLINFNEALLKEGLHRIINGY